MSDQLKEIVNEVIETGNAWIGVDSDVSVSRVKYEIEEKTHKQKTVRKGREKTKEFPPWSGQEVVSEEEVVLTDKMTAREKAEWRDEQVERNQARELGPDCYTG